VEVGSGRTLIDHLIELLKGLKERSIEFVSLTEKSIHHQGLTPPQCLRI